MREYRFAGIEPCEQGDHGWFVLAAVRGKGEVRIPLSASDARELIPADPRLRTPAELLAEGLRNTLRLFGEEPEAVRIEVRREGDRQVIGAGLCCAGGAELPIACTAALLIGLRWRLRFHVQERRRSSRPPTPRRGPIRSPPSGPRSRASTSRDSGRSTGPIRTCRNSRSNRPGAERRRQPSSCTCSAR